MPVCTAAQVGQLELLLPGNLFNPQGAAITVVFAGAFRLVLPTLEVG
jgi:hypothetical protein